MTMTVRGCSVNFRFSSPNDILPGEKLLLIRAGTTGDVEGPGSLKDECVTPQHFKHYPVESSAVETLCS
jgi:hypothetical protein